MLRRSLRIWERTKGQRGFLPLAEESVQGGRGGKRLSRTVKGPIHRLRKGFLNAWKRNARVLKEERRIAGGAIGSGERGRRYWGTAPV